MCIFDSRDLCLEQHTCIHSYCIFMREYAIYLLCFTRFCMTEHISFAMLIRLDNLIIWQSHKIRLPIVASYNIAVCSVNIFLIEIDSYKLTAKRCCYYASSSPTSEGIEHIIVYVSCIPDYYTDQLLWKYCKVLIPIMGFRGNLPDV
jgi:hypothetical protein